MMTRRWKEFVDMVKAVQTQQPTEDNASPATDKQHPDSDGDDNPPPWSIVPSRVQTHPRSSQEHNSRPTKSSVGFEAEKNKKKDEREREVPLSRQGNPAQKNAQSASQVDRSAAASRSESSANKGSPASNHVAVKTNAPSNQKTKSSRNQNQTVQNKEVDAKEGQKKQTKERDVSHNHRSSSSSQPQTATTNDNKNATTTYTRYSDSQDSQTKPSVLPVQKPMKSTV